MEKREVKATADGSKTLFINELNEGYHSGHGALQEAVYVFIENGLKKVKPYDINILELGFGTGLNVLVTIDELLKNDKNHSIRYFGIEKYPVKPEEVAELSYSRLFDNPEIAKANLAIHQCRWNEPVMILPGFELNKINADFYQLPALAIPAVDLVYFDCFGARVQPDLWEPPFLKLVAHVLKPGGLLTTYSSKGSVRRALQELGFTVTKLAGPPGKREMINAVKN